MNPAMMIGWGWALVLIAGSLVWVYMVGPYVPA